MELLIGAIGVILGGLVSYTVARLIDKAKIRDRKIEQQEKFEKVIKTMQPFIEALRSDLEKNNWECFEFYIKEPFKSFTPNKVHYQYLPSEFKNIYANVGALVEYKFIAYKHGFNSVPIYRLDISFIEMIRKWEPGKTKIPLLQKCLKLISKR